jgi:cytoskeletal protein CcmA (bactofilin family)
VPGGNGPFPLNDDYSYEFQILDDDDPALFASPEHIALIGENNDATVDTNNYLILRAIGRGPRNTTVILARMLESVPFSDTTSTGTPSFSNPAILVNGDLDMSGADKILGSKGNVHANGNIIGNISGDCSPNGNAGCIKGDVTATGSISDGIVPLGFKAANQAAVSVPEVRAQNFKTMATWILPSTGFPVTNGDGSSCGSSCPSGWTFSGGTWSWSGNTMPPAGNYYAEGSVTIHGTGNPARTAVSIFAEGNLAITGNGKFETANESKVQFVTNGDFIFGGNGDADDPVADVDGLIMVREQVDIYGSSKFQGRVVVQNIDSTANSTLNGGLRAGTSLADSNRLRGSMTVTYNGKLKEIETPPATIPGGAPTYTNNVSGWIEQ